MLDSDQVVRTELLIPERVTPVAAPDLAEALGFDTSTEPAVLADKAPLLQFDALHRGWMDWEAWFERAGVTWIAPAGEIRYRNYANLVQQALSGRGIALGWDTLLGGLEGRGLLVPVGPTMVRSTVGYHLVWPTGMTRREGVRRLRSWLRDTVASLRSQAAA